MSDNNRLEKKIHELEQELQRKNELLDHLPCTVSWVTKDLQYIEMNKKLADMLGMDLKDIAKKEVGFLKSDNTYFKKFVSEFFEKGYQHAETEYAIKKDGKIQFHKIMAQKYKNKEEAVIIGLDITKQKQLEKKIKDDERLRLIAELTTGIVHEIKNPLTVIQSSGEMLEELAEKLTPEKIKKYGEKIVRMSENMEKIIDGLKNLGRKHANDPPQATNFHKILDEALLITNAKISHYQTDLIKDFNFDQALEINCIEGKIIQVLVNLIGNACEAAAEHQDNWVRIKVNSNENELSIRVIDSGTGIPDSTVEKMFEAFFTTKPKGIGTGMGLGICKEIADSHEGSLNYCLEGKNTCFELKLPILKT